MNEKEKQMPSAEDFLPDEPPLAQEAVTDMPELTLYPAMDLPQDGQTPIFAPDPVILPQEPQEEALPEELPVDAEAPIEEVPAADTAQLPVDQILAELKDAQDAPWDAPAESNEEFMAQPAAGIIPPVRAVPSARAAMACSACPIWLQPWSGLPSS